jgi:hypothetical protein
VLASGTTAALGANATRSKGKLGTEALLLLLLLVVILQSDDGVD